MLLHFLLVCLEILAYNVTSLIVAYVEWVVLELADQEVQGAVVRVVEMLVVPMVLERLKALAVLYLPFLYIFNVCVMYLSLFHLIFMLSCSNFTSRLNLTCEKFYMMKTKLRKGSLVIFEIPDESLAIKYLKYRDLLLVLRSQMSPLAM